MHVKHLCADVAVLLRQVNHGILRLLDGAHKPTETGQVAVRAHPKEVRSIWETAPREKFPLVENNTFHAACERGDTDARCANHHFVVVLQLGVPMRHNRCQIALDGQNLWKKTA